MRHRKSGIKLNRTTSHRNAMFRNMVTSLFKYDRIKTTDAKAKELRRWADDLITLAKRGDLHARRQAMAIIREKNVVQKLFESAGQRYGERSGGYTRIIKLGKRPGDAADVSIIELITGETIEKKKKSKPKSEKKKPAETKPDVVASAPEKADEAAEDTTDPVEAKETTAEAVDEAVPEDEAKPVDEAPAADGDDKKE